MERWLKDLAGHPWLGELAELAIVLVAASLTYFLVRWAMVRSVRRFAASTSSHWDDELVKARVFHRLAHIAPAFVVYYGMAFFPELPEPLVDLTRRVAVAAMIIGGRSPCRVSCAPPTPSTTAIPSIASARSRAICRSFRSSSTCWRVCSS